MSTDTPEPHLPWIESQDPLPPVETAWGADSDAPGLLAAGTDLGVNRLLEAYGQGVFPWFNPDQPVLWWSPDPRMVLKIADFKLHRSLRKTLTRYAAHPQFQQVRGKVKTALGSCQPWLKPIKHCTAQAMRTV
jgi:Leu/Phe-tRNA-protein transferase